MNSNWNARRFLHSTFQSIQRSPIEDDIYFFIIIDELKYKKDVLIHFGDTSEFFTVKVAHPENFVSVLYLFFLHLYSIFFDSVSSSSFVPFGVALTYPRIYFILPSEVASVPSFSASLLGYFVNKSCLVLLSLFSKFRDYFKETPLPSIFDSWSTNKKKEFNTMLSMYIKKEGKKIEQALLQMEGMQLSSLLHME